MITPSQIRFAARCDYRDEGRLDGWSRYSGAADQMVYCDEARQIEIEDEDAMGLLVKDNAPDFELPPAGNHVAACYMVVDLGMQDEDYQGQIKHKHKVRISWELSTELMADGRPFSISKKYTAGLTSTGNLRPDLESWRGRPFTADELKGFELENVLTAPCLLNVIHQTNEQTKKTYAVVSSIAPLPRGMTRPVLCNKPFFFSLTDADAIEKYNGMEEWLQKLINIEPLRARMRPGSAGNPVTGTGYTADPEFEDIPF